MGSANQDRGDEIVERIMQSEIHGSPANVRLMQARRGSRLHALVAPIVVLLIALPLIRLRGPADLSDNEAARLATVQALVEQHSLAIDKTLPEFRSTRDRVTALPKAPPAPALPRTYSKQPPVLAFLLAIPYTLLHALGITFNSQPKLVIWLLTVIAVTIPVSLAAGLIYRMGRLFELPRKWRAGLAVGTVCASGMISYATAINSNAPAAVLVLAACASFFHVATAEHQLRRLRWLAIAGTCAALAAVIDLAALVFLLLLVGVIIAMRSRGKMKIAGIICYALGASLPIVLHAVLTIPVTGDLRPGFLHSELMPHAMMAPKDDDSDDGLLPARLRAKLSQIVDATLGAHGLLSHFPAVLLGIVGVGTVLRRHWPIATKTLAVITVVAGVAIIGGYIVFDPDWRQPMFSVRWFVIFVPLLLFWAGAWLRTTHHRVTWAVAAMLLAFSTATSLIGATNPFVSSPAGQYTAYTAVRQLFKSPVHPATPTASQTASVEG